MTNHVDRSGLSVAPQLAAFVEDRALPGTGVDASTFWAGFAGIVADLGPKTREMLAKREEIQAQIDAWHVDHRGQPHDVSARNRLSGG